MRVATNTSTASTIHFFIFIFLVNVFSFFRLPCGYVDMQVIDFNVNAENFQWKLQCGSESHAAQRAAIGIPELQTMVRELLKLWLFKVAMPYGRHFQKTAQKDSAIFHSNGGLDLAKLPEIFRGDQLDKGVRHAEVLQVYISFGQTSRGHFI